MEARTQLYLENKWDKKDWEVAEIAFNDGFHTAENKYKKQMSCMTKGRRVGQSMLTAKAISWQTSMDWQKVQKAIIYATEKHEGQKRKGTDIPYIVHPMEVMQILSSMGCPADVVIAGILHDTLEDTTATPKEIEELFGADVLNIVQHESEDKSMTWKERKQHTIDSLAEAPKEVRIVCFADKLSNIRSMFRDKESIGEELWKRFNAGRKDIEWYYRQVAEALRYTEIDNSWCCNYRVAWSYFKEFELDINCVFDEPET